MDNFLREQTDHHSGTTQEVAAKIRKRTGVPRGYHIVPPSRQHLLKYQPKAEDLPPRSMQDSFTKATVPLSADELIRERYVTSLGRVRLGRLMEDIDMFAVWLCHRHILVPDLPKDVFLPYTFVTMLVDRVEFTNTPELQVNKDIELSGFVSWTGRSSMETTIFVRQVLEDDYLEVTRALFLMVARNAINSGPAPANPLKPANETEQNYWEKAKRRQKERMKVGRDGAFITLPMEHENAILYNILKRTSPQDSFDLNKRILPGRSHWMVNSKRSSIIKPFPQNRNAANTIFGGYLMRLAVELSTVMAEIYVKSPTRLKCISDISFLKPIQVTDSIEMHAHVVYTSQNYVQILTVAQAFRVGGGQSATTNIFFFTFEADAIVDEVLPGSYREMMWYIHGRRKFLTAMDLVVDDPLPAPEEPKVAIEPAK